MTECGPSVAAIAANFGVNPDTIYNWITRKSMTAHAGGQRWKLITPDVNQRVVIGFAMGKRIPISKPIDKTIPQVAARLAELKKFTAAKGSKPTTKKLGKA